MCPRLTNSASGPATRWNSSNSPKCCARQLPRQFGEGEGAALSCGPSAHAVAGNGRPLNWAPSADTVAGEHGVLTGDIVPKTLALLLKQSTKEEVAWRVPQRSRLRCLHHKPG